jgi:hypothetical protein
VLENHLPQDIQSEPIVEYLAAVVARLTQSSRPEEWHSDARETLHYLYELEPIDRDRHQQSLCNEYVESIQRDLSNRLGASDQLQ